MPENRNRAREGPGSQGGPGSTTKSTCQQPPPGSTGTCSLVADGDGAGEARWFGRILYSAIAPDRPSTFSLTRAELAAHARQLHRAGWQRWEIRARLDLGSAA